MSHIAYLNGRYLPHAQAKVHIEDRGYQFADGIYEYVAFFNRMILDEKLHLDRFERSLCALSIAMPVARKALSIILEELIAKNSRDDGGIYFQTTRGATKRDHPFPKDLKPSLSITIWGAKTPKKQEVEQGAQAITAPDERWARCDVKSISLLPNVLAKQKATLAKVRESFLFLPDETVTEGSVSNAFIVKGDVVRTHPLSNKILGGVTRDVVLTIAKQAGIKVDEQPFSLGEAFAADEVFITSTSANVMPIVSLDGKKIGSGKPGDITKKLLALYHEHIFAQTGKRL